MNTQKLSVEEEIRQITADPTITVESSSDRLTIAVQIEETRRRISITVNGNEAEITYKKDDQITPERVQEEIARHSSLLELAESLRSEQYALTNQAVDREMDMQRALQFVPPQLQPIIVKIINIVAGILMLLQFKSPSVQESLNIWSINRLITLAILKRAIVEIGRQKATYEGMQSDRADQQLAQLVEMMGKIIYVLRSIMQQMANSIQADERAHKALE